MLTELNKPSQAAIDRANEIAQLAYEYEIKKLLQERADQLIAEAKREKQEAEQKKLNQSPED